MKVLKIILIVLSALVIVSFFIPYFSESESTKSLYNAFGDMLVYENAGVTTKELVSPSLFTFTKIYVLSWEQTTRDQAMGIFYGVLYCTVPFLGLLLLLFALVKKPIPGLIFSIFLGIAAYAIRVDFNNRNLIVNYGIGHYMLYILPVLIFAGSIVMIVLRSKDKRRRKPLTEGQ